jgi:hypothetical protein
MLAGPDAGGAMLLYLELCVLTARDRERWSAAHGRLRGRGWRCCAAPCTRSAWRRCLAPARADLLLDGIDGLLLHRVVADPTGAAAAAAQFAHLVDHP